MFVDRPGPRAVRHVGRGGAVTLDMVMTLGLVLVMYALLAVSTWCFYEGYLLFEGKYPPSLLVSFAA